MKRFVSRFEGGAVLKRALSVVAVLCLTAGAALFSGCDLGTGGGPDSDATLKSLTISEGTLTPSFSPATRSYQATVAYAVTNVTITGVPASVKASVSASSGTPQLLEVGPNTVTITVTAESGAAAAYTVTVTREADPDAPPPAPVIQSVSIKSSNTQTNTTDQGGAITVTWGAVTGATGYEVYYAAEDLPPTGMIPSIPEVAAKTVTVPTTTATITATGIGNDTMNYYVWVKAVNGNGASDPSEPASTLDRFIGHWTDPMGYDDGMYITNADFLYEIMEGYGVYGYIRAVVPFNNNQSVNFNTHNGPAGVIIIEYDDGIMSGSYWTWAGAPNYFNAVYYYGLSGSGVGATAYLGVATKIDDYSTGPEVADVDAAIAKFTLADKDSYISAGVAAAYEWEAYP
jgi:hypothetical protein